MFKNTYQKACVSHHGHWFALSQHCVLSSPHLLPYMGKRITDEHWVPYQYTIHNTRYMIHDTWYTIHDTLTVSKVQLVRTRTWSSFTCHNTGLCRLLLVHPGSSLVVEIPRTLYTCMHWNSEFFEYRITTQFINIIEAGCLILKEWSPTNIKSYELNNQ